MNSNQGLRSKNFSKGRLLKALLEDKISHRHEQKNECLQLSPTHSKPISPKFAMPVNNVRHERRNSDNKFFNQEYFFNISKGAPNGLQIKKHWRAKSMFDGKNTNILNDARSIKSRDKKSLKQSEQKIMLSPKRNYTNKVKITGKSQQIILNHFLKANNDPKRQQKDNRSKEISSQQEIFEKKTIQKEQSQYLTPHHFNPTKMTMISPPFSSPNLSEFSSHKSSKDLLSFRMPLLKMDSEKIVSKLRLMSKKLTAEIETEENKTFKKQLSDYQTKHKKIPPTTSKFYEIIKCIGEGSFGKVYLAHQRSTNRLVAIKRLEKTTCQNEGLKKKINNEIEIQKSLFGHTNIVKLLEVFESNEFFCFVMEYAANGDLLKRLKSKGKFGEDEARYILFQIGSGLRYIQSQGFIHRDIKLDNVLIDDHNRYKICDFGVGRNISENELVLEQCGTPAYLAPEIIKEQGYRGFAADIWSLGILTYFMIVGQMPFRAPTIEKLNEIVLKGNYSYPDNCPVSKEAKHIISRMLCIDPTSRATIDEVLNHKWINSIDLERATIQDMKAFELQKKNIRNGNETAGLKIKEDVISLLADLGFEETLVRESLLKNEMNYATASYFTLEKDFI